MNDKGLYTIILKIIYEIFIILADSIIKLDLSQYSLWSVSALPV